MPETRTIPYLPIQFWNRKATSLRFVNQGDFNADEFHKKLGIAEHPLAKNLSTSNRDEILRRQEIVRLLYKNRQLRDLILNKAPHFGIPNDGQMFLNEFNPKITQNDFWVKMNRLEAIISQARLQDPSLSREIVQFHEFLKMSLEAAEEKERAFGASVSEKLEKIACIQGQVILETKDDVEHFSATKAEGYGYKKYSYFTKYRNITKPKKWRSDVWQAFLIIVFPIGIAVLLHNLWQNHLRFSPLIIDEVPDEIKLAIEQAVNNRLNKNEQVSGTADHIRIPHKRHANDLIRLEIYFVYDSEKGLRMQIVNLETVAYEKSHLTNPFSGFYIAAECTSRPIDNSFNGYSFLTRNRINTLNVKMERKLSKTHKTARFTLELAEALGKLFPKIFETTIEISAQTVPGKLMYGNISGIYHLSEILPLYNVVLKYREYLGGIFEQLRLIASLVDSFDHASKKWNVPISFPKILDSEKHLITFRELIPVHLIDRKTNQGDTVYSAHDLRAIHSLAPLNGKMLALTGQNAGGKTVTMETLIAMVYLAQAGLPIFGTEMHLNPKKTIAMCFIERGEGSTAQLLLMKIKNVLQAIDESTENGILVVMDELGTGTQETAGADLGTMVLRKLASKKCSVIFSSQITSLVQFSQKEFGALPFKFNLAHEIQPGIGQGDINLLVDKLDMRKYLTVKK